ncbi:lysozyme inhibitor LprI family protein [Rhizobium multihospitium]|uniref:Uncharacterized conserved protein YecT, DUF1311 family n=1 Tax=Rhizobium multihospitium TaxID=410764 RepID=A0A1C3TXM1_9HYPH|nr:lysozyme inhibitor LprI family protein [Rhizobium multihospitium]SCB07832.1 Uncharacterized conserved protein YecT, DUF1311 family [Rhizobium multihospitium]
MRDLNRYIGTALAAVTVLSSPVVHADEACYKKAHSQAELTECSQNDLKQVDGQLNKLYKEMEARLKGDDDTTKLLVDAQKKWVVFRDAECALTTVRTAGGSINAMNFNACLTGLTQSRVKDFQNYLSCSKQSGDQDDDDCSVPAAN